VYTLPELTSELFDLAGENVHDYLPYTRLDLVCTYFYEDGTRIRAFSDATRFAREVEDQTGEPSRRILAHLEKCRRQYDLTANVFLFSSLHKPRNYIQWRTLKGVLRFHRLDAFTTMHRRNRSRFRDARVVQLFDRYATYNGSNPYAAPATLNVIGHLEHNLGVYFPNNGMRSLTVALETLARRVGVEFHFSRRIDRVVVENGTAVGLSVEGREVRTDLIVSDADVHMFYSDLLPEPASVPRTERDLSSSALIFCWGVDGTSDSLGLHNILFSGDYRAEFEHIFDRGTVYHDPTVYISISSKMNTADAPRGAENWFVMVNAPPDGGQDWDRLVSDARRHILQKIDRVLGAGIERRIGVERIETPQTIAANTLSYRGALYGRHSNSRYSAFLRHPYKHRHVKNLYFVGGSVHPGGGIPLCLASAKIVDQEIRPVRVT
jgi:phytoene desaturase